MVIANTGADVLGACVHLWPRLLKNCSNVCTKSFVYMSAALMFIVFCTIMYVKLYVCS